MKNSEISLSARARVNEYSETPFSYTKKSSVSRILLLLLALNN